MYKVAVSLTSKYLSDLTFGINRLINKCHKNDVSCDVVGFDGRSYGGNNQISSYSVMLVLTANEPITCIESFHYYLDNDTLDF